MKTQKVSTIIMFFILLAASLMAQTLWNDVGHIPFAYQEQWNRAGLLRDMSAIEPKLVINITPGDATSQVQNAITQARNHLNDAQNLGSPSSLFLDFGIGKAPKLFKGKGTSAGFFLNFSKRKNTISIRTLGNMEYIFRAGPEPVESYSDLSILWGHKLISNKYNSIVPLIGAGKITSIKRGKLLDENSVDAKHEKLKDHTIGISLGIKFQVNTKHTGYSLYLFSNINSIKSYYGSLFCFGLGKFY